MNLHPDITELIARARADMRMGVPVVLFKGENAMLTLAAETVSEARLAQIQLMGPDPVLAITTRRAQTLKARAYDDDVARIILPAGSSLEWVQGIADPADDLKAPLKGPFQTQRNGSADLHRTAIALAKSARLLPAVVMQEVKDGPTFASDNWLTLINLDLVRDNLITTSSLEPVVSARLPLAVSEAGQLHVFRPRDGGEEHYAVEIGRPDRSKPVLVRLHSACFTGDLLGSLKCDCGPQLHTSMALMGEAGSGVLLYLNQEGRGIGLANKMRAYSLQNQGFDTVEANHRLGFEDDERDFRIGASILKRMGFEQARLMTNNPKKVEMMQAEGINVTERVPLKAGHTAHNADYLKTKSAKSGHLL